MILILDYESGNLRSVFKAIESLGRKVKVSSDPRDLKKADRLILPGVGEFKFAVKKLREKKLFFPLKEYILKGKPFLGICLGMQVLFEKSQESKNIKGLGLLKGEVKKISSRKKLVVPHMGWNRVFFRSGHRLFRGIKQGCFFYFAHSYYCKPYLRKIVVATTHYALCFTSAINKDNIYAVQFHPEKSQKQGLKLLKNFLELC